MVVVGIKKQSEYEKRREKFCVFEELKFVSAIRKLFSLPDWSACLSFRPTNPSEEEEKKHSNVADTFCSEYQDAKREKDKGRISHRCLIFSIVAVPNKVRTRK